MPVDWQDFEPVAEADLPSDVDWSEFEPVKAIPGSIPATPPPPIPMPEPMGRSLNEALAEFPKDELRAVTKAGLESEKRLAAARGNLAGALATGIEKAEAPIVPPEVMRLGIAGGVPLPPRAEGVAQSVAEIGSSFTSPINLGLAAVTGGASAAAVPGSVLRQAIPRGVALGFGGETLRHTPENLERYRAVIEDPNATEQEKTKAAADLLLQTGLGVGITGSGLARLPKTTPRGEVVPEGTPGSPIAEPIERIAPEVLTPETKGVTDAIKDTEATTLHGSLRQEPIESQRQVPTEEGRGGVQPPRPEAQTAEVLLTPEETKGERIEIPTESQVGETAAPRPQGSVEPGVGGTPERAPDRTSDNRRSEPVPSASGRPITKGYQFTETQIEVSKPSTQRKTRALGDDITTRVEVNAPLEITRPDIWPHINPDHTRYTVEARGKFEERKPAKKSEPVWRVYNPKTRTFLSTGQTYNEAISTAKRLMVENNFPPIAETSLAPKTAGETQPTTPAAAAPEVAAAERVRVGKSPQPFTVLERLEQSATEKAQGEQPIRVKNEKTGEESVVLEADTKPITGSTTEGKVWALLRDQWQQVEGKPLKLKAAPNIEFSIYRQVHPSGRLGDWVVIENSTGRALRTGPKQRELVSGLEKAIEEKGGDAYLLGLIEANKKAFPNIPPKPAVTPPAKPIKGGAPEASTIDPGVFTPEALPTPATKRLGITPAPELTGISRFLDDAKKYVRRKGTASRGLPEPAYAAEQAMRGQISAAEKSIKQTTRDLKRALAEVYQLSKGEVLRDDYRRIPTEAREAMDSYLKGAAINPEAIPAPVRGVLDNMRAEITGLSENIIRELERAGGNDKLIDTIRNNMDVYVNRSYRFFDSKRPAEAWYYDLDATTRRKAEEFLVSGEAAAGKALAPEQARSLLLNWLSDLKDSKGLGSSKLGAKDLTQFMRRKEIAPEIKAILGEYKDPLVNYARSVTKMTDWLANQRFLSTVRDAGMGKWLFTDETAPPGFNARIAAEGSETMSPLNGLRTTPEIAEVFKSFGVSPRDFGVIVRTYLKLNAITKIAATTQSLLTQMRNLGSQPWFWGMNGHWRLGELGPTLKAVAEDLGVTKEAPKGRWREYLQDAARHGIVGDTARATELREIIRDAAFEQATPEGIADYSVARLIKRFAYKLPGEVYKLSDELGKIYGWENEKAIVRKVHPEWTEAQVKQEAAARVRDGYPTYSKTPEWLRAFRHLPFGPFVSFPYEVLRTSGKAIGRSIQEMRSENPIERQIGRKRAASQVATLGSGFALAALSRSIWDITQQEEDDLRRFLPPWAKNSQLLYLGKQDDGKLKFLNLSYQNPYSYMVDPVVAAMASANTDEPFIEAMARTAGEFFAPYISEQMLANALLDVSRNTTETGRPIYNPQDDIATKAIKVMDHVGMTLAPGTAQRARRRIIPSFSDEQPDFGRKLSPGIEVGAEMTGLRLEQFDFKTGLGYKTRQFIKDANNAEGIFRSLVNKSGTVPPDEVIQGFETAQARRFELWSELRKDYLAALRSGVPINEARQILSSMGLSQALTRSVDSGVYIPWVPGRETLGRMMERRKGVDPQRLREIAQQYQGRTVPE